MLVAVNVLELGRRMVAERLETMQELHKECLLLVTFHVWVVEKRNELARHFFQSVHGWLWLNRSCVEERLGNESILHVVLHEPPLSARTADTSEGRIFSPCISSARHAFSVSRSATIDL